MYEKIKHEKKNPKKAQKKPKKYYGIEYIYFPSSHKINILYTKICIIHCHIANIEETVKLSYFVITPLKHQTGEINLKEHFMMFSTG